ncbi:MAG: hypothetical protein KF870_00720 [Leadbetterella sp.]|nr:hypothetical protein [Leadbetterella sp.]
MNIIIELNTAYNNFVDEEYAQTKKKAAKNPRILFEEGKGEKDLFLSCFSNFLKTIDKEESSYKKAKEHYSFTIEESFVLFFYTSIGSNRINSSLSDNGYENAPLYVKTYTKLLENVLGKLPSFNENEIIHESSYSDLCKVLRKEWMTSPNTIRFPSFISSHKGEKWGNRPGYYIKILTSKKSRGKDITKIKANEQEVLFMTNTEFKILEVKGKKIRLEEI